MVLYAALTGALVMGGIILLATAFRPPPPKREPHRRHPTLPQRLARIRRRTKNTILIGLALGVAAAVFSGIGILLIVVPAAVIGLPILLGKPDTRERDLLSALESWSRSLSSAAETGSFTLREIISITRASTPPILRAAVDRLSNRIDGSWSTSDALRQFATEMDSANVDEVAIYLIQAADYNAGGLTKALEAVADMLAEKTKDQLETAIEREKPRRSLTTMTSIIVTVLAGIIVFSRTPQIAVYRTPLGETILAIILASFVLLLVWAKSQTRTKPEPRIVLTVAPTVDDQP